MALKRNIGTLLNVGQATRVEMLKWLVGFMCELDDSIFVANAQV
jgi:hypothetical protein